MVVGGVISSFLSGYKRYIWLKTDRGPQMWDLMKPGNRMVERQYRPVWKPPADLNGLFWFFPVKNVKIFPWTNESVQNHHFLI